jgi:DNA repair exonuclease SbcCD nuclease subunit
MLIAHLSDLHLGRKAAGDELGAQRLQSLRGAIAALAGHSPEILLVAGDMFDGSEVDPGVVQAVARVFDRARKANGDPLPVVLIPGNHDPADAAELWRTFLGALPEGSAVRVVLEAELLRLCDGRLLVEAYPCATRYSPEPPWVPRLESPAVTEGISRAVLAHGTLEGGPVPEGESEAYPFAISDAEALGVDYVALGHFHGVYPPWPGNDEIVRAVSYCGTHEPDQFGSDAGWALLATLEPGRPTRVRRLRIGRGEWRQIQVETPGDLQQLRAFQERVESDPEPNRFYVRLKPSPSLRLSIDEARQFEAMAAGLRAVGARVDQSGQFQTRVSVESLDLDSLPAGAVRQAMVSLREEWETVPPGERRDVLAAALQLGWEQIPGQKRGGTR